MTDVLDSPITTKQCRTCQQTKPIEAFYLTKGRPRPQCKVCFVAACAARNRANRAKKTGNRSLSLGARIEARQKAHPPLRPLREADVVPLLVTLVERAPNGCAYPYGDAGDYRFCGHDRIAGKPYCGPHCAIAYRPRDELTPVRLLPRCR
jgi:hypothetical protein